MREEQEAREKEELNAQELEIQRIQLEKELTVSKVPLEPEPSNPNACNLQIKLGERTMKRRFLMTDTVEVILIIKYELEVLLVAIYAYKNNLYKLSESSNFFFKCMYKI